MKIFLEPEKEIIENPFKENIMGGRRNSNVIKQSVT